MTEKSKSAHIDKSGDLDPEGLDVAKRPRRRRARNRPDPSPELRAWEVEAEKRAYARPYPPGVMLEAAGLDDEHWTSPHNDSGLWTLQLADAFGTRSKAVFITFMAQLEKLTGKSHWDEDVGKWRLDENEFSASLAIINSTKPRNEIEACQAAQMVAVHLLTMKVGAYAIQHHYDSRTALTVAKLANAFSGQVEAMQSLKGRNRSTRQKITVKRENHYHDHRHVHDHRGPPESGRQSHGGGSPAEIIDHGPAVRCDQSPGVVVPLAGRKGKNPLPISRSKSGRS